MENKLFPGRGNYTGPTAGWFGLLHHDALCDESHDVMERVAYVKDKKPAHEVAIRLHNMIYLSGCEAATTKCAPLEAGFEVKRAPLNAEYWAKRSTLDAECWVKCTPLKADYEVKRATLDAEYWVKCAALDAEILAYIRQHIPDCAWNGKELEFSIAPK